MTKHGMKGLGAALAAASLMMMTATSAHADVKCRATVAKSSAGLTQTIAKILQKCEQSVHDGKISGPCPGSGQAKIDGAKQKLKDAINKACATSTGEFAFGRCPNETGADGLDCGDILIQSKDGVADCLSCLADHNAQELVHRVLYSAMLAAADKDIGKCQATIGKSTVAFYTAASKSLAKCQASLLKGKVASCPDLKTQAAVDKAETKKQDAIKKACCGGDDCGGATCSVGTPVPFVCQGGTNNGVKCTTASECPGGQCSDASNESRCSGGTNDRRLCQGDSSCPGGGHCVTGPALCEAASDCGRCQGGTDPGKLCRSSGQCDSDPGNCNTTAHKCIAGANANASCSNDSECPGSTCSVGVCAGGPNIGHVCAVLADCPSTPAGTCVGTTGLCGGSNDANPITDIGVLPNVCPGITTGGAPIAFQGVTGVSILNCVDPQAQRRVECQDAAGATFGHDNTVPPFCVDTPVDCAPTGPTHTATVTLHTTAPNPVNGVSINLGYKGVNFPGTGEVTGSALITSTHAGAVANDNDDSMTLSVTDLGTPIADGENVFVVTFGDCGAVPTAAANYGCVVRSASDSLGNAILDGVSCSVSVP